MTDTYIIQPRSLVAMQRRLTAYEVVALAEDGTELRLGFTERRTKAALIWVAQGYSESGRDDLIAMLGDWDGVEAWIPDEGWVFGPVRLQFSGRTERDVATA